MQKEESKEKNTGFDPLNTHTISILKRETVIAISLDMHVLSKWTELNEE